jgi:sugar phosphate isomerase/epimerase
MVKWGVHSLLWTERFDIDPESVAKKASAFGFDGIEIFVPPAQIETFDEVRVRRALRAAELECIGCTCLDEETDVSSPNEATRRKGIPNFRIKTKKLFQNFI